MNHSQLTTIMSNIIDSEEYTIDNTKKVVCASVDSTPTDIINNIRDAISKYTDGTLPQKDRRFLANKFGVKYRVISDLWEKYGKKCDSKYRVNLINFILSMKSSGKNEKQIAEELGKSYKYVKDLVNKYNKNLKLEAASQLK